MARARQNDVSSDPRAARATNSSAPRAFAISMAPKVAAADDDLPDTGIRARANIDPVAVDATLEDWMLTIPHIRFTCPPRRHRRRATFPGGACGPGLFVRPDHDGTFANPACQQAFDQLSPEHRDVLIFMSTSGLSCVEAAQRMGVAERTLKSRINRARQCLAALMPLALTEEVSPGKNGVTGTITDPSGVTEA